MDRPPGTAGAGQAYDGARLRRTARARPPAWPRSTVS